jgi:signal transduction histidine kinase
MKLATLAPGKGDTRRIAGEISSLLEDVITKTRTVTFELSPPVLYELGLEAAAEWIGQSICAANGLEFAFEDDGAPKPVEPQALPLLFRGTRELLMNTVKHASARRARVSIARVDGVVRLLVSDDGLGFDSAALEPGAAGGGFGLFSLRERLQFLGGSLEIESRVGEGSQCVMTVPVADAER